MGGAILPTKTKATMTSKEFNRNVKAKVYGKDAEGNRINQLVGFKTYNEMFGEFAPKFYYKFMEGTEEKHTYKLRSKTYRVTLYYV